MIKKLIEINCLLKQEYQKPMVKVVELQYHTNLLQASPPKTMSGEKGETPTEDKWVELE